MFNPFFRIFSLVLVTIVFANLCLAQSEKVEEFIKQGERFSLTHIEKTWTLERMANEADLIVIFEPSTGIQELANAKAREEPGEMSGLVTYKLKVMTILKAAEGFENIGSITVTIYASQRKPGYSSGSVPSTLFAQQLFEDTTEQGESNFAVMCFLKKSKESGVFEPVAGNYFPDHSFRILKRVEELAADVRFVKPIVHDSGTSTP